MSERKQNKSYIARVCLGEGGAGRLAIRLRMLASLAAVRPNCGHQIGFRIISKAANHSCFKTRQKAKCAGMTPWHSRTFLGSASLERECQGFHLALRRATVPPEAVPEHAHETAHLILAIADAYLSGAVGAAVWGGLSMLVYNPPGTLHRDRFASRDGRFLSVDIPPGFKLKGILDPMVIRSGRRALGQQKC